MVEYFRWLYYDATYMQFKVEEMKWGFGFFLVAGTPLMILWVRDQFRKGSK